MKLALDASAVPRHVAGAGRYVVELATRLPAFVDTTLVVRRDDEARWRRWSPDATVVAAVPTQRVARLTYEALRLGTSPTARAAEVWHAPHYTMARRGSTPTVVTIHDLTFFTNPEWHERAKVAFFTRAITYAAHHAKVLVCVSELTSRQLDEFVSDHAPVVVAPHGVDLDRFSPTPHEAEAPTSRYVLFLGTFEPRKGVDVLLESFSELAAEDDDVELWLAGQAGWGMDEAARTLRTHPFASRIRQLGFVDDAQLPGLIRGARAVAYPSRGEGFGLPVLEALACGAPVVTTRATVMQEVAGDAATLVDVGDASQLADALGTIVAWSDAQRAANAVVARARAQRFTWEASVAAHVNAYDRAREK